MSLHIYYPSVVFPPSSLPEHRVSSSYIADYHGEYYYLPMQKHGP